MIGDQDGEVTISRDHRSLRRGSVAFLGTVGSSVGIQAPAGGVSFLPALMAGLVGLSGPVAFGSAVVLMLFVAYAFVVFTRDFASAGSVYSFAGRVLGVRYGMFAAWLLLLVYVAFAASVFASNANALVALFAPTMLGSRFWLVMAALLWASTMLLVRYSIRVSTLLIFVLEAVALMLIAIVAVAVLAHQGPRVATLNSLPFDPVATPVSTLAPGVIFAFTGFAGFEVAATLGEESKAPRRVIPAAMVVALLVSGLIYTAMSYVETVAFPSAKALAGSADAGVPLATIADRYVGPGMGIAVIIASVISGYGAQLAAVNGASRLLYAAGRGGIAPATFGMTHPRHRTPTHAIVAVAVATIVPLLALNFRSPLQAFDDLATYGADLIVIAYLLTLIAAVVYTTRRHRFGRAAILLVGIVLIGYVIIATIWPFPTGVSRWYLVAAGISLLAGAVLVTFMRAPRLSGTALFRSDAAGSDSDPDGADGSSSTSSRQPV